MSDLDKIIIFIPEKIKRKMEDDCENFGILKKNNDNNQIQEINFNEFCNRLIFGYYNDFCEENNKLRKIFVRELDRVIMDSRKSESIATRIINKLDDNDYGQEKSKNLVKISVKPTSYSEDVIYRIKCEYSKKRKTSKYFRKMFISYCNKPMFERERIIFSKKYADLEMACRQRQYIIISTKNNPQIKIMPYKIAEGEERFNYLLGIVNDGITGEKKIMSLRINRILNYSIINDNEEIEEYHIELLERMIEQGPQFVINDLNEQYCVQLTEKGKRTFDKIYFGRPKEVKVEKIGEYYYYYFNSSENQMYLYFRRFEPGEAKVIENKELMEKIIFFHKESLKLYEEDAG